MAAGADAPIKRGVTTKAEAETAGVLVTGVAMADAVCLGVADATGVLRPGGGAMDEAGVAVLGVAARALGVDAATLGVALALVLAADKDGRATRLTNPPVAGVLAFDAD